MTLCRICEGLLFQGNDDEVYWIGAADVYGSEDTWKWIDSGNDVTDTFEFFVDTPTLGKEDASFIVMKHSGKIKNAGNSAALDIKKAVCMLRGKYAHLCDG